MRLSRRIAGYALLRVTGLSPERVLTGLAGRGIPFWNAEAPRDYEMTLRVPARRAAAAGRIAAAAGCGAEVLSLHGLPRLAALLKRRRPAAALTWSPASSPRR